MPKNLLDMMRKEDREAMENRFKARIKNNGTRNKVSNEMYLLAEFGLMYGWEAVQSVRRNEITFEEMFALLEAGRKVQKKSLKDEGRVSTTAIATAFSKTPASTFEKGTKFLEERSN